MSGAAGWYYIEKPILKLFRTIINGGLQSLPVQNIPPGFPQMSISFYAEPGEEDLYCGVDAGSFDFIDVGTF